MRQPTFFDKERGPDVVDAERITLRALGDFQSRGLVLAERELPLDRLRGALKRASEALDADELPDDVAVAALRALGARVRQVPSFVAKHPFRVTVPAELAERSLAAYRGDD
ncbi:MAG TPA: hypothetical protein VGX92_14335 [Pyrinomonadaceae bacterium]|jgi:hypothetical protein|nr:hypothetical protein [Pyrinomonadaceae bacterium]